MDDVINRVEAILFTIGRFISLEELAKLCDISSVEIVKENLEKLREELHKREGAIELIEQGNKWKLNIRKEYLYLTENLLTDCELEKPVQETLAVIAYKSPVLQSEVIKIRGNGAYGHIEVLKELDFIISEKFGRTRLLKVTQRFYDYFDVVEDQLKSKLGVTHGN